MTPSTMSRRVGDGRAVGEILAAFDGVDQDGGAREARARTSHQRMRLRKRADIGNSRKLSISTKATWV